MADNPPWKPLVLNEKDDGPEGNVWTGCKKCGKKWRSNEGWIYREKNIPLPQEVMKMMAKFRCPIMAKWEYRCPGCFPNDYKNPNTE